jgi:hypothetical protein
MALQQLAWAGAYDPLIASPPITPPPLPGKVFHNNTVGGSIAARKMMIHHINRRVKEAEAEQTSGGEDPRHTCVVSGHGNAPPRTSPRLLMIVNRHLQRL